MFNQILAALVFKLCQVAVGGTDWVETCTFSFRNFQEFRGYQSGSL